MARFRGRPKPKGGLPAEALARILDLVQQVAAEVRPEQILQAALRAALDLSEAERGFILLRHADGLLEVLAARDREGRVLEDPVSRVSRTVVDRTLAEGRPLCVDEARVEAGLAASASVAAMQLRAVLCVPFRLHRAEGVFYLDNRFASGVFGEASRELLAAFCGPVALLLRHAELEEELERTAGALRLANRRMERRLRESQEDLRQLEGVLPADTAGAAPFPELLGGSPALEAARTALQRCLEGDWPVLIHGESGTGKDLAARALHRAGPRRREPFLAIQPGALGPGFLEAELFGVRRGAYSGADEDRAGILDALGRGILYVDGVEDLPSEAQAGLLRLLDDGGYRPLGGGEERRSQVRLVFSSRLEPGDLLASGRLREDFYYRIRVLEVRMPPLRERLLDLEPLLEHFLKREEARLGVAVERPGKEMLESLRRHAWPGNVRELAAFATNWVVHEGRLPKGAWPGRGRVGAASLPRTLRELEDAHLLAVLEETGGNKTEAARRLGISRRTLYNRLAALRGEDRRRPEV